MKTAQRIRIYLIENEISQKWLSEKTGISRGKLSLILRGKRKLEIEEFVSILAALGEKADAFIDPGFPKKAS